MATGVGWLQGRRFLRGFFLLAFALHFLALGWVLANVCSLDDAALSYFSRSGDYRLGQQAGMQQ